MILMAQFNIYVFFFFDDVIFLYVFQISMMMFYDVLFYDLRSFFRVCTFKY